MADIMIQSVTITPNPVITGKSILFSVHVADVIYSIMASNGQYLESSDGNAIQRTTGIAMMPIAASSGKYIENSSGKNILARKIR